MAKKKFDESKHYPIRSELETLSETFAAYARECTEAARIMRELQLERLIVSNWGTAQKAVKHLDNTVRQVVAAAKFGHLDPRIQALLSDQATQQAADAQYAEDAKTAQPKPKRKTGGKT